MHRNNRPRITKLFVTESADTRESQPLQHHERFMQNRTQEIDDFSERRQSRNRSNSIRNVGELYGQGHGVEQQWEQEPSGEPGFPSQVPDSPTPNAQPVPNGPRISERFAHNEPNTSSSNQPNLGRETLVYGAPRTLNRLTQLAGPGFARGASPLYGGYVQQSRLQKISAFRGLGTETSDNDDDPAPRSFDHPRPRQAFLAPPTPRFSSPPTTTRPAFRSAPTPTRPRPPVPINPGGVDVVSPLVLDKKFHSVFPYQNFNAIQSACFSSVYESNYNVVVSAPTGSGKTVIFELAICRMAAQIKKDFKIVFQAPTKALCSERVRDWQKKFQSLGLQVAEFTGDTSAPETRRVRTASIIVTTPEKWDSVTRKWTDYDMLLKNVRLFLIDEVHILKDKRGATLETVVSRMKSLGADVRFVALSATIPNSVDIAQWLGLNHTSPQMPAKMFVFGDEYRPVPLEKIVHGYHLNGNEHSFDSVLDDKLPQIITKYSQRKPVLVFCFSRKSCESAAMILADYWDMCSPDSKPWPKPLVESRGSIKLKGFSSRGVAYHHGGIDRQDRAIVEESFLRGHLSVICCTSTLAVGVNLPCHTVILKGTMGYQNGRFVEYDEFEIMQMIGRAGRPQFDTSATAIILTRTDTQERYKSIGSENKPVESTLHLNLMEHINSEAILGTITSLEAAVQWLRGTFMAIRVRRNPSHYQLAGMDCQARNADEKFREICVDAIERLSQLGLIKYEDNATVFHSTEYGRAMSTYMVHFDTMGLILGLDKDLSTERLLNSMCRASEFDQFRIKSTERPLLRELNKTQDIPFKFKDSIIETWQKISLLIQTELSRGILPHQQRLAIEARQAAETLQRLLESYAICKAADGDSNGLRVSLELSRSLAARAWEGHHAQLCQIPDIGPANMAKLVDKKITTVLEFANLSSMQIGQALSKNLPSAMKLEEVLRSFPRLHLEGHIERHRRCENGNMIDLESMARVEFGQMNDAGVPRWKNKVPLITFFAETGDGKLLHLWRGKLQEKSHPISFPVPAKDSQQVTCHITYDEVVGTIQSRQLRCSDDETGFHHDLGQVSAPEKAKSRKSAEIGGENASKRQKLSKYQLCSLVVDNTEVECIDLSSVDDDMNHEATALPTTPPQFSVENKVSSASSALWSSSVRTDMSSYMSGNGSSVNPWMIDESETADDFDTDIFDDMDLSKETAEGVFETAQIGTDVSLSVAAPEMSIVFGTDEEEQEVGEVVDGHEGMEEEFLPPKEDEPAGVEAEAATKACSEKEGNISEPTWVGESDRDVIDFLRGHVKFV